MFISAPLAPFTKMYCHVAGAGAVLGAQGTNGHICLCSLGAYVPVGEAQASGSAHTTQE